MKYFIVVIILIPLFLYGKGKLIPTRLGMNAHLGLVCFDSVNCYGVRHNSSTFSFFETTDQGLTWNTKYTFDLDTIDNDITGVHKAFILDTTHWYFISSHRNKSFFLTENAGKSFRTVTLTSDVSQDDMLMINKNIGFFCTYYYLAITDDNWQTWDSLKFEDYRSFRSVVQKSDSIIQFLCYSYSDKYGEFVDGVVELNLETMEYKRYFEIAPQTEGNPNENHSFNRFYYYYNSKLGFLGNTAELHDGVDYDNDIIFRTSDGGKTWEEVLNYYEEPNWGIQNMEMRDELYGIVVGGIGQIYETFDGGKTWERFREREYFPHFVMDVEFAGSKAIISSMPRGMFHFVQDDEDTLSVHSELYNIRVEHRGNNLFVFSEIYPLEIYIYNLSGVRVSEHNITNDTNVPLFGLKSGAYIYEIRNSGSTIKTGKFFMIN